MAAAERAPLAGGRARRGAARELPLRLGLLLDHPSGHLTALLEALARRRDCRAGVVYLASRDPAGRWLGCEGPVPHRVAGGGGAGLGELMRGLRAEVWVVGSRYTQPATWRAARWLRARGVPWVLMTEPPNPGGAWPRAPKDALFGRLLRSAAALAPSGRGAAERLAPLARAGQPVSPVPYYVDLAPFLALGGTPGRAGTLRVLCLAQLVPRKGIDLLLDALGRLPDGSRWRLDVVGSGPGGAALRETAARRWPAGPPRVRWLGPVPFADRARVLAGYDLFVLPSRWDGWGMALVEAMAAGLPVVASDAVMSARELVADGENGFVVPAGRSEPLARRLAWCLTHRERLAAMGAAARRAAGALDPDDGARRLLDLARAVRPAPDASPTASIHLRARAAVRRRARRAALDAVSAYARIRRARGPRILVYHHAGRERGGRFAEHLDYLCDHFELCTPAALVAALAAGERVEDRLAVTFDDGLRSVLDGALDRLEARGVRAGFFVSAGFVAAAGDPARARAFFRAAHGAGTAEAPLGPRDLAALAAAGHEVGAHGVDHLPMGWLDARRAWREVAVSRRLIARWTGAAVAGFAYPYGECGGPATDPGRLLRRAGYAYALTTRRGRACAGGDPYRLPREHVEGDWPVRDLRSFLAR